MDELVKIIGEIGIPFAYDHFAEGLTVCCTKKILHG